MSAPYVEDWQRLDIDDAIAFDHPQHLECHGWWVQADTIVCCCGAVLFSVRFPGSLRTVDTVPTQGGVL